MQDFDKSRAWKAVVVQMAQWAVLQYTEKVGGGKKMEWNIPNKLYSSLQKKHNTQEGKAVKMDSEVDRHVEETNKRQKMI